MHLGSKIKEIFESRGITIVDFAKQIGTVRQNVYRIFERSEVDTDMLMKISEALDYDFFQYFKPKVTMPLDMEEKAIPEEERRLIVPSDRVSAQEEYYKIELEMAHKEIEYLKKMINLMEERISYLSSKK